MNKSQKIWLWVSAGLFLIPEMLWSPLGNFLYSFFMPTVSGSSQIWRDNFILNSQFDSLYKIILLVQLISIISFTINWVRSKNYFTLRTYWLILVLSIFLSLGTLFLVFVAYAVANMSFP